MTKDGVVVIFHDKMIDRMTEGTGAVNEYTLEELKSYPITHPLQNNQRPQYVPTLKEYLIWVNDKPIITNIELKSEGEEDEGLEQKVSEILLEFGLQETVIVSSFDQSKITRIKQFMPTLKTGLLLSK